MSPLSVCGDGDRDIRIHEEELVMAGTRELKHPEFEIEGAAGELLIRFRVPGSTFGLVEIVLSLDEADTLVESLEQALVFAE